MKLKFTQEEFDKIEESKNKYWNVLDKTDHIYIYEKNPSYSSYLMNIFKYEDHYLIEDVCRFGKKIKCDDIEGVVDYMKSSYIPRLF